MYIYKYMYRYIYVCVCMYIQLFVYLEVCLTLSVMQRSSKKQHYKTIFKKLNSCI